MKLSGGQRRRIHCASDAKDAPILLLDEGNECALDSEVEAAISKASID